MNQDHQKNPFAALIIVGGFAGTGKMTVSRRLSAELSLPRLGADTLGRIGYIKGISYWIIPKG